MSGLGDFFGSFTGATQNKYLDKGNADATAARKTGLDQGTAAYGTARDMYNPYAAQGGRANTAYGDATGANGADAYRGAMASYAGSDPFRDANAKYANDQIRAQYNARGQSNGGNADLAVARAQTERGATDWGNYLNRLQGQGQMGFQATNAQAGLTQGIGDMQNGYGQQSAQQAQQYAGAKAGAANIGVQNLMGLAGTAIGAFAPGWGGMSAAGNIGNALFSGFGGSSNSMGNGGVQAQNPAYPGELPWQRNQGGWGASTNRLQFGYGRGAGGGN